MEENKSLQPEEPLEAKTPETPQTRVQQELDKKKTEVREFKKDIRFLWIYATVFCVVLLAMIGGSAVIQRKMNQRVENYRTEAATATATTESTKSRLSNIQDENKALKKSNESLTRRNETLTVQAETDAVLIAAAEETITELDKLVRALNAYTDRQENAAALLATVDRDKLSANGKLIYDELKEKLR